MIYQPYLHWKCTNMYLNHLFCGYIKDFLTVYLCPFSEAWQNICLQLSFMPPRKCPHWICDCKKVVQTSQLFSRHFQHRKRIRRKQRNGEKSAQNSGHIESKWKKSDFKRKSKRNLQERKKKIQKSFASETLMRVANFGKCHSDCFLRTRISTFALTLFHSSK